LFTEVPQAVAFQLARFAVSAAVLIGVVMSARPPFTALGFAGATLSASL
jgi:hypothetical protein